MSVVDSISDFFKSFTKPRGELDPRTKLRNDAILAAIRIPIVATLLPEALPVEITADAMIIVDNAGEIVAITTATGRVLMDAGSAGWLKVQEKWDRGMAANHDMKEKLKGLFAGINKFGASAAKLFRRGVHGGIQNFGEIDDKEFGEDVGRACVEKFGDEDGEVDSFTAPKIAGATTDFIGSNKFDNIADEGEYSEKLFGETLGGCVGGAPDQRMMKPPVMNRRLEELPNMHGGGAEGTWKIVLMIIFVILIILIILHAGGALVAILGRAYFSASMLVIFGALYCYLARLVYKKLNLSG